jgi:hypothetical protein
MENSLLNYDLHPSFKFREKPWELDQYLIDSFNKYYSTLQECGHVYKPKIKVLLKREILHKTEIIFSNLLKQTIENFEQTFLLELKEQALRLVSEQVDFFFRNKMINKYNLYDNNLLDKVVNFHENKFLIDSLKNYAISEINNVVQSDLAKFRDNAAKGNLTREALSIGNGKVIQKIVSILNKSFEDLGVLDILSIYTQRDTRVSGCGLELSVPKAGWWKNNFEIINRPPHTLYAHLDESIDYPKAIVYLTNVNEKNGPTSCYPKIYESLALNPFQNIIGRIAGGVGSSDSSILKSYYMKTYHQSMNSENYRRHFMKLPKDMRFNSHFGWDVIPDSILEQKMINCEKKVIGNSGTFIVFDGAKLVHRGGLIEEGERLALQVIFTTKNKPSIFKRIENKVKQKLFKK